MKLKKNNVINILFALFLVFITVYILFNYTPLNTIFDVYEGLRLSYDNVSVEVNPSNPNLQDKLKGYFKQIDNINKTRETLVPSTASTIRNDSYQLLTQFLRIKQNIERTYPESITTLTDAKSKDKKPDRNCPTSPSDINTVYADIIFVIYYLRGIQNISDVKTDANRVIELCIGENTGLRYYLKRLMESMNNYVGMANQNPVSGNGQQIVTEFKSALTIIKRILYQIENMITHNEGDINGLINQIKEYVKNFGRKDKTKRENNKTKVIHDNEHTLPSGAEIVRRGKCYPDKCSWSNK